MSAHRERLCTLVHDDAAFTAPKALLRMKNSRPLPACTSNEFVTEIAYSQDASARPLSTVHSICDIKIEFEMQCLRRIYDQSSDSRQIEPLPAIELE